TTFGVDIHPAARMGKGVMLDHATGLVIGETAVVGNNVSILQSVTLGGTGKDEGDRHPKIGDGVLISAGAKILGNIHVGEGAKVGAGSVVLEDVPPHTTVAGVPAKIVGRPATDQPALDMNHDFCCDEAAAKQMAG
ncbi:MAG: serine O-acetyltransferase, partial [Halieaceae bacterium]|nr:serine O-acetyltransferase [Halieaceae bacterium]